MKADMADKEMLESSQSKYEEEVREKCSIISDQKAVRFWQASLGRGQAYLRIYHADTDFLIRNNLLLGNYKINSGPFAIMGTILRIGCRTWITFFIEVPTLNEKF